MKHAISTHQAPAAIGTYSQAIKAGNTVYISGQIPLLPDTMELIEGDFKERTRQVFRNLSAIIKEAGGDFSHVVKLAVYLTDMDHFAEVNEVMAEFCEQPYPARAAVAVKTLPKNVDIEIDAILYLGTE